MFLPTSTREKYGRHRFPIVCVLLALINIIAFGYEVSLLFNEGEGWLNDFIVTFGVVPAGIMEGRGLTTLITAMFLHGGLLHIAGNMLFLLVFGDNVEDRMGPFVFILFYLGTGVLASLAHIAFDPQSTIPSIGASGAIAGVLAAYLVFYPTGKVKVFVFLGPLNLLFRPYFAVSAFIFIGFWFIMQFIYGVASFGVETAQTDGVAYWAHIGGFVAGIAIAFMYWLTPGGRRLRRATR